MSSVGIAVAKPPHRNSPLGLDHESTDRFPDVQLTRNSALEFAVADFTTPVNPATPTSVAAAPTCVATQFSLGRSVTGHDIQCSPCCASSEVLVLFVQDPEVSAPSDLSSTPAVEYVLQEVAAHTAIVIPRYTDLLSYLLSSPAAVLELQKVITSVL